MLIEIETYNLHILSDLMGSSSFKTGQKADAPGGATITLGNMTLKRSAGIPDTITLIVSFAGTTMTSVGIGLFTNWLYDKLSKSSVKTLRIDRREVRIEREEITHTVTEATRRYQSVQIIEETTFRED